MQLRFSPQSRMIAAVLACTIAFACAAAFAFSNGLDYVATGGRIDRLLQADGVLSELSSTMAAPQGGESPETATRRFAGWLEQLRAERATARRHLDMLVRATALLGALGTTLVCLACAMLARGIRERKRLADALGETTHHDALTGLPNRRFFAEWLAYAIAHARRHDGHVGVLFIDISGCIDVAELHGGPAVEALLVEIARRFRAASREGDVFARLGASEFALATPNASDGRQLATIAQRLRDALNDPAQPPLADSPIGTSIGIAFFPEDAGDPAGVMAAANAAMYAARRAGRDHVAFSALAA